MKSAIFECRIITPMFLNGADGKTLEIRAPSIKGMMRFWWRAINGHMPIEELRKEEGKLFGASDEKVGRSKFALKVIVNSELQTDSYKPVPTKNFIAQAFKPTQIFTLILTTNDNFQEFEKMHNLLVLSTILGGFGKRSRRGFGSVEIVKINDADFHFDYSIVSLWNLLNVLVPDVFQVYDNKIKRIVPAHSGNDYPFIEEIQIGEGCRNYEKLLKVIGESSHKNDCEQTGFAKGQNRFASPIYVSVIKNGNTYKPIISRLHCAPKNSLTTTDKSSTFISDILVGCK